MSTAHVITISDRVSAGQMEDQSGPALLRLLRVAQFEISGPEVVPDVKQRISAAIEAAAAGFVVQLRREEIYASWCNSPQIGSNAGYRRYWLPMSPAIRV